MSADYEDRSYHRDAEKRAMFDRMTAFGIVTLQFDARREGVDLPEHLEAPPNMLIKMSPRFATYLHVDAARVSQMLSFPGYGDLPCSIPWSAVYALHPDGGQSAVWALDVPPELRRAFGIDSSALS